MDLHMRCDHTVRVLREREGALGAERVTSVMCEFSQDWFRNSNIRRIRDVRLATRGGLCDSMERWICVAISL